MEPILLKRIIEKIASCRRFLITSHVRLDGDAIGSELALYHMLRGLKKEVCIYNQDPVPKIYGYLPGAEAVSQTLEHAGHIEAAFLLDCSEIDRVGEASDRIGRIPVLINIDHHISNRAFCELAWIDAEASSTGEMIFRLADALGAPITEAMAVNLYTAILTDTGSFRYSNTGADTFMIAAKLVQLGARPFQIAEKVYDTTPVEKVLLLSKALETLAFDWEGRIGSILVSQEMFREVKAQPEHADSFADFVRSIEGVEVGVFYTEIPDGRYKVSFRSRGRIDVEKIASQFGGGGHAAAAACRVEGDFETARKNVNRAIMESPI